MAKTEVYSWRLDPTTKSALESAAHARGETVARILDTIVGAWLERQARMLDDQEDSRQRKLHQAAEAAFGVIRGGDPSRAENASDRVRARLEQRRAG